MKPVRQKKYPHVTICVDRAQSYGGEILKGITKYVNVFGPWTLSIDPRFHGEYEAGWLKNWRGDGMIAYVEDPRLAKALKKACIPVVEVFGHRYDLELPQVCPHGLVSGQLAAQHLIDRKFTEFAFCGYRDQQWSEMRQEGFVAAVKKAGFSARTHLVPRQSKTLAQADSIQEQLNEWITRLPLPIGIMACSDRHAQRVLVACRLANISVPEEIAIIGSGNDEELCHLSHPALSSVIYDTERVGYQAAQLLDQIMAGKAKAAKLRTTFIPPLGIATRRSTEVMAIQDRLVANVVRFIREHACDGLSVDRILSEFDISRSTFYRHFENVMGRSPHEEILRMQLERTKNLLTHTSLAIERIAELSGFPNTEYLYVAFKREIGQTPRDYRQRNLKSAG
ncbi:MAG: transcriptional regulator [Verrucomicrobiales bacterium]|nr:transcriptional regulator [Verrucomicrobiales bacterium]